MVGLGLLEVFFLSEKRGEGGGRKESVLSCVLSLAARVSAYNAAPLDVHHSLAKMPPVVFGGQCHTHKHGHKHGVRNSKRISFSNSNSDPNCHVHVDANSNSDPISHKLCICDGNSHMHRNCFCDEHWNSTRQ